MSKRLLALNLLLAAAAVVFSIQLVRVLSTPRPVVAPAAVVPTVQAVDSPKAGPGSPRPSLAAYGVVATRNLFNPNRTEAGAQGAGLAPAAKPVLQGVVINGTTRLAYLEDPATKRVFGYKTGDAVAGGQLEQIEKDRVVILRPEGPIEVKLKDPSKPKPVASAPHPPGVLPLPVVPFGVQPLPSIAPSAPGVPQPVLPGETRPSSFLQLLQGATGTPGRPPQSP